MTVYAITNTKKGEQGLRLLIFKLPKMCSGPPRKRIKQIAGQSSLLSFQRKELTPNVRRQCVISTNAVMSFSNLLK